MTISGAFKEPLGNGEDMLYLQLRVEKRQTQPACRNLQVFQENRQEKGKCMSFSSHAFTIKRINPKGKK